MRDVVDIFGAERRVVVAREVTKLHEEFLRGRAADILAELDRREDIKGEITLLIAKEDEASTPRAQDAKQSVAQRIRQLMQSDQMEEKTALKQAAKEFGLARSEAYREWQRAK